MSSTSSIKYEEQLRYEFSSRESVECVLRAIVVGTRTNLFADLTTSIYAFTFRKMYSPNRLKHHTGSSSCLLLKDVVEVSFTTKLLKYRCYKLDVYNVNKTF